MEKFILEINATSDDGNAIQCETKASVSCSEEMAVGILVNVMKQNDDLKELMFKAVMALLLGKDDLITDVNRVDHINPDDADL